MTEQQAKRSCIAYRRSHDKYARECTDVELWELQPPYDENLYSPPESCDCSICEDVSNKLDDWPLTRIPLTWRQLRKDYLQFPCPYKP